MDLENKKRLYNEWGKEMVRILFLAASDMWFYFEQTKRLVILFRANKRLVTCFEPHYLESSNLTAFFILIMKNERQGQYENEWKSQNKKGLWK